MILFDTKPVRMSTSYTIADLKRESDYGLIIYIKDCANTKKHRTQTKKEKEKS